MIAALDRALLARIDAVMAWLGVTGRRKGNRWTGGMPGARIEVVLTGSSAGAWGAWSAGKKGRGLIGVIAFVRGIRYGEAIREARAFLGERDPEPPGPPPPEPDQRPEADRARRIANARKLWAQSRAITGTIAELYLTKVRGFLAPVDGWPDDVRFHPPSRALILPGRDAAGEVQFVHRVFLTIRGDNVRWKDGGKKKITDGPMDGAAFRLPGGDPVGPVQHAEGGETAIAAWLATGLETRCRFGALGTAARLEPGRCNILFADDDPAGHPTETALQRALPRWQAAGLDVVIAYPWPERRHDKSDVADVLRLTGLDAVRERVRTALLEREAAEAARTRAEWLADNRLALLDEPPFPLPTATADEVHGAALHGVQSFFALRRQQPPPHNVLPSPTGSGKTQKVGDLLPHIIAADKADRELAMDPAQEKAREIFEPLEQAVEKAKKAWDVTKRALRRARRYAAKKLGLAEQIHANGMLRRAEMQAAETKAVLKAAKSALAQAKKNAKKAATHAAAGIPYRAVVAVPDHRLSHEIAERYAALGLSVAILEGRGDPWKPPQPDRPYLCKNLEPVGLALLARQSVNKAVCGPLRGKRKRCAFRTQCGYFQQFRPARDADVLIIANTFLFERQQLRGSVLHDVAYVVIDEDFTQSADNISELSIDNFRRAALEAWPALDHGGEFEPEANRQLIELSERVAAMFDAAPDDHLDEAAPHQHALSAEELNELSHLHWMRKRDAGMHPAMTMDERRAALKEVEINQHLPRITTALRMLGASETARLRLFTDTRDGNAHRGIVLHGQRKMAKWVRNLPVLMLNATARIEDVRRFFPTAEMMEQPRPHLPHQHVHQYLGSFGKTALSDHKFGDLTARALAHIATGKELLLLVHQQSEAAFKAAVPSARVMHHGNYAGDNHHGDVDVIMHIGGPFPKPREIAEMATARNGIAVREARPERRRCGALMEDGAAVGFERLAYEDPCAQAVHESIYDQAFIQGGLGRGRGINRSAETPLRIEIYGNVPLPVPLASLERWRPSRERALLADGATHSNAGDLYRFTDRFRSEAAAEKWRHRNPFDENWIRALLAGNPRPHVMITWQPIGQGHKSRRSIMPAALAETFRRLVEDEFGGVVGWQVEQFTGPVEEDPDISHKEPYPVLSGSSPREQAIRGGLTPESSLQDEHPPGDRSG